MPLGELDHGVGGADEEDELAVVEVHRLVAGGEAGGVELGHGGVEVVDAEADVVEAGAGELPDERSTSSAGLWKCSSCTSWCGSPSGTASVT